MSSNNERCRLIGYLKVGQGMALLCASTAVHSSVLYGQDFTSVGASSFVFESPYNNQAVENTWSPFIALQYKNFFIRDAEVGYQVLDHYDYGAALSLSADELSQQRRNNNHERLSDIDDGLNVKGSMSIYRRSGIYTLTIMRDISGVHNGLESTISWGYPMRNSAVNWYPSIYASWMDAKLLGHYFSTEEADSANFTKAGWRYGAAVTLDYHPSTRWLLQTNIANESYSKQVTEEPSIERSHTWLVSFNVAYFL